MKFKVTTTLVVEARNRAEAKVIMREQLARGVERNPLAELGMTVVQCHRNSEPYWVPPTQEPS